MTTIATVSIDCEKIIGELKPIWNSIAYDEINGCYTQRGQDVLRVLKDEVCQRAFYVRNHNAFTSGNYLSYPLEGSTNIYREDQNGNPIYYFDVIDRIYDTLIANNLIPHVEFNFMPFDLVPKEHQSDYDLNGWKYPPKDYQKWFQLVQTFIQHLEQRYGKQIENWIFEVWNEPNIDGYWLATVEDYCKLYDYSVEAVKSVNPNLKVGGPVTTDSGQTFLDAFLKHVTQGMNYANQQIGSQIDFISFHSKGASFRPSMSFGHPVTFQSPSVQTMLDQIQSNLNIINKYQTLANVPVYVDECDPVVGYRYGIYDNKNYLVCNNEYYPSIVAAIIYNILKLFPRVKLMTTSAFYLDGKRMFEGNRMFVTNYNIYLPILNGIKLIEKLQTKQLNFEITNNSLPLNAFCTIDQSQTSIQLLIFSHIDDYSIDQNQNFQIILNNLQFEFVLVKHYKIDTNHNNTYSQWIQMGQPQSLNQEQLQFFQNYQQLTLLNPPILYEVKNKTLTIDSLNIFTHSIDFFEITKAD